MVQVSTDIRSKKERKQLWKDLQREYGSSDSDFYLRVLHNRSEFHSKGKLIEFRTIDLGEETRDRRIKRFESEIRQDTDELIVKVDSLYQQNDKDSKIKADLDKKVEGLRSELANLRKGENFISKIINSRSLQIQHEELTKEIKILEDQLAEIVFRMSNLEPEVELLYRNYQNRLEIMENALVREGIYKELETERIQILKKQKDDIITELKHIEDGEELPDQEDEIPFIEKIKSDESLFSVIRSRIQESSIGAKFKAKKLDNETLDSIVVRAKRLELRRLNELIGRLENAQIGKGRVRERYYLSKNFDKDGDLVCFSRKFRGSQNLESEMSHIPRVRADPEESLKIQFYLIGVLMLLNVYLLGSDILGLQIDLFNYHSFYWLLITGMMFYNSLKIQSKDPIFDAKYFYLDTSFVDIQYYDKENTLKSVQLLCYHLELFYSTKQDISAFLDTTEADIIEAQDTRLVNLTLRQQKEITNLEIDLYARSQNEKLTMKLNQDLAHRYTNAEKNAEENLRRTLSYKDPLKTQTIENIATQIIKYSGVALIIIIVSDSLAGIGGLININTGGGEGGSIDWTVSAGIGFILGILTMIFVNRFQHTRG